MFLGYAVSDRDLGAFHPSCHLKRRIRKTEHGMHNKTFAAMAVLLLSAAALAQQNAMQAQAANNSTSSSSTTTVRGCLTRDRGNYVLVEDKTGLAYVLKGVADKVSTKVGRVVEVTGQLHPVTVKTGVRSSKSGSNPADTVHGVDGVPIQVANVDTDVKTVADKCTAADDK